jgi:hypothetical protein
VANESSHSVKYLYTGKTHVKHDILNSQYPV